MPQGARVGVFGGSYDPIHLGHLAAAEEAREALGLDRVLLVPAGRSPHKAEAPRTPGALRLAMVRAALEGEDFGLLASEVELRRPEPSYTVDTLAALSELEPGIRLHLILGADQWSAFDSWRAPREIARLAEIVVVAREGEDPAAVAPRPADGLPYPFRTLPIPRFDISSTLVRERVRAGRSIRFLVPSGVRRIIEAEGLYR